MGKVTFSFFSKKDDEEDLYDDAMAPSSVNNKRESTSEAPSFKTNGTATQVRQESSSKRYCCYVGNMTWWSTDADLQV